VLEAFAFGAKPAVDSRFGEDCNALVRCAIAIPNKSEQRTARKKSCPAARRVIRMRINEIRARPDRLVAPDPGRTRSRRRPAKMYAL